VASYWSSWAKKAAVAAVKPITAMMRIGLFNIQPFFNSSRFSFIFACTFG
jgi:hypothetical protein